MEINKVGISNISEVLSLIDEYDRPVSEWPNRKEIERIYASIIESGGCVIGAFINGSIIGTCTVNICPNLSWSGRPYAIIENVIVSKDYRNKGVGKSILQRAKEHAFDQGCYKVSLMTGSKKPETLKFYESAGFMGNKIGYQIRQNA